MKSAGASRHVTAAALVAALLVGFLRWFRLGDLSPARVAIEVSLWGLFTFVVLGAWGWFAVGFFSRTTRPQSGRPSEAAPALRPEELNEIEDEIGEIERPEVRGVPGKAPEELAEALRALQGMGEG